jgi:predicted amidohydrolase YtcJ
MCKGDDLIEGMKKYGIIANVQPQFVHTDSLWAEKRLHPDLLQYSYAWKTLLDRGVVVTGNIR